MSIFDLPEPSATAVATAAEGFAGVPADAQRIIAQALTLLEEVDATWVARLQEPTWMDASGIDARALWTNDQRRQEWLAARELLVRFIVHQGMLWPRSMVIVKPSPATA